MGHQWSHSVRTCSGAPGWPGAGLRTPVNGLPAAAHWAPWTRWPKKSETKMSLSATCRSGLDKGRQWPIKPSWLLHWKGNADHNGTAAPAGAALHPPLCSALRIALHSNPRRTLRCALRPVPITWASGARRHCGSEDLAVLLPYSGRDLHCLYACDRYNNGCRLLINMHITLLSIVHLHSAYTSVGMWNVSGS